MVVYLYTEILSNKRNKPDPVTWIGFEIMMLSESQTKVCILFEFIHGKILENAKQSLVTECS